MFARSLSSLSKVAVRGSVALPQISAMNFSTGFKIGPDGKIVFLLPAFHSL